MPNYIFAYHGGKAPETAEEGEQQMQKWGAWFAGLGEAIVNPGNPVGQSWTVAADGERPDGGANPLAGFSIVKASSIEAAAAMAKGCPILESGTVEVAEIIEM